MAFQKGSTSRSIATLFIGASLVVGTISQMSDNPDTAPNMVNTVRDTGQMGAGTLVGSAQGADNGNFEAARKRAAAPSKKAPVGKGGKVCTQEGISIPC